MYLSTYRPHPCHVRGETTKLLHRIDGLLLLLHSLKDIECIESIRNYGLLGGIDIQMMDKPGKAGFQVYKECYKAGINIKPTGDALLIAPPFICDKKNIDEIIEKLRKGITNFSKS